MSSKLTERDQVIITFHYTRSFTTNVTWAVYFNGNEKNSFLNLHNNDWYNYTIKLLMVIRERFFMLIGKL